MITHRWKAPPRKSLVKKCTIRENEKKKSRKPVSTGRDGDDAIGSASDKESPGGPPHHRYIAESTASLLSVCSDESPNRRGATLQTPARGPAAARRGDASGRQEEAERHDAVLGHEAIVDRLHVVLHFVGPRELLAADGTGEDLALVALVVEERVPLEAVLVLEGLLDADLGALGALVDALAYRGVPKEVEPAHRHLGQLFGRVLGLGGGATAHAPLGYLPTGRGVHGYGGGAVGLGRRARGDLRRPGRCRRGTVGRGAGIAAGGEGGRGRRGRGQVAGRRGLVGRLELGRARFLRGAEAAAGLVRGVGLDAAGAAAARRVREV